MLTSKTVGWAAHVVHMCEMRNSCTILIRNLNGRELLEIKAEKIG